MQGFEYMELSVMKSDAVFQMMFDWLIETTVLLFWIFWSLVTLDLNFCTSVVCFQYKGALVLFK